MINAAPADTPVTRPPELTVAISGVPLDQVPPPIALLSEVVPPTQTPIYPDMPGFGFTVTTIVVEQPASE